MDKEPPDNVVTFSGGNSGLEQRVSGVVKEAFRKSRPSRNYAWPLAFACIGVAALLLFAREVNIANDHSRRETHQTFTQVYQGDTVASFDKLPISEKAHLTAQMLVLFPELFSKRYGNKYDRARQWLRDERQLQHHHLKSLFTSIGRREVVVNGISFGVLPGIFVTLDKHHTQALLFLQQADSATLEKSWGVPLPGELGGRVTIWAGLMKENSAAMLDGQNVDVTKLVKAYAN